MLQKSSKLLVSNIVGKDRMREFQEATLLKLKDALINSFGPFGSNTVIEKESSLTEYTKDGHKILKNIVFQDAIESTTRKDIEDITRHIVKTVGDGTTSAILLASIIFELLKERKIEEKYLPYELIKGLKDAVKDMGEIIQSKAVKFTPEAAYDITYIATNGNEEISGYMRDIYERYGNNVFIDVTISNDTNNYIKEYDGMTLEAGYSDVAYVTDRKKNISSIRCPQIYTFVDPIDTPEMGVLFDGIISHNIVEPLQSGKPAIPTVIFAPKMSRDMSGYMEGLLNMMYSQEGAAKPSFLFITNIYTPDQYEDISRMCGCRPIIKYINPDTQEADIKAGIAPTPETVWKFAGTADLVESDPNYTKVIRPAKMLNENGEFSREFITLRDNIKARLEVAKQNSHDALEIGTLKRRYNSISSNLVEFLIGGVSVSDRDSLRDLVEDAVLNCRSAAEHGVGFGANFEGLRATRELIERDPENDFYVVLNEAYTQLVRVLLSTAIKDTDRIEEIIEKMTIAPYNLKKKKYDAKVKSSIKSDIFISQGVADIVSLIFTSNQFLTYKVMGNRYYDI